VHRHHVERAAHAAQPPVQQVGLDAQVGPVRAREHGLVGGLTHCLVNLTGRSGPTGSGKCVCVWGGGADGQVLSFQEVGWLELDGSQTALSGQTRARTSHASCTHHSPQPAVLLGVDGALQAVLGLEGVHCGRMDKLGRWMRSRRLQKCEAEAPADARPRCSSNDYSADVESSPGYEQWKPKLTVGFVPDAPRDDCVFGDELLDLIHLGLGDGGALRVQVQADDELGAYGFGGG